MTPALNLSGGKTSGQKAGLGRSNSSLILSRTRQSASTYTSFPKSSCSQTRSFVKPEFTQPGTSVLCGFGIASTCRSSMNESWESRDRTLLETWPVCNSNICSGVPVALSEATSACTGMRK
eukprot:CAMPEP_0179033464 /NCGR_PEP_ID=MMETSP0796-20121207/12118_1 /TAXON_ID=73915 /ORGANISM="Pyrodinium bahamense, Strain pbaha01" /LENGTH=120 /DNA_ID=CAMNT_0020729725 /DNA_START=469 /DNA_END=828 /DNA_ORIENTATION=+